MNRLIAWLAALLLAIPLTAAAPRPWTSVATPIATGSYLIGNPKARVKLVEYVSYTCPHCAHFMAESGAELKKLVASGSTSIELRNQVHDKVDLVAATLARCAGPAVFPALHEALFARQTEWVPRAFDWDETNGARLALYPQLAQLRAMADGAGLTDIAHAAGMSQGAIDQCFASDAAMRRVVEVSAATVKVRGTPAFEINGRMVDGGVWAQIQPQLRAAGAR
jgi:protein-disulfide isomerase